MLTKQEKKKLRNIRRYKLYTSEKDGIPVEFGKKIILPTWVELKEKAINEIIKNGFSKVEQVSPKNANCIIRIFCKLHSHYDEYDEIHNLYGFMCYTKSLTKWFSLSAREEKLQLDFSNCELHQWFYYGEYVNCCDCEFVDIYLKVS